MVLGLSRRAFTSELREWKLNDPEKGALLVVLVCYDFDPEYTD